ncbi:hypothetical protein JTE90_017690 [Oedothorax gibbosus]|uniref:DUF4371 domain-containing protein n=1 Tax=Oedothorax gibbosus TaxID=931172 RepID=A0AAV6V1T2_9ARAC|nr:hypothetical protein JTE90_017690 [Oedothorax gibbosus]
MKRLLPHPYKTDCKDYELSWKNNNNTGPVSREMCELLCVRVDFKYFERNRAGRSSPRKECKMLLDSYGEIEPFNFDSVMDRTEVCKCIVNNCKKDCCKFIKMKRQKTVTLESFFTKRPKKTSETLQSITAKSPPELLSTPTPIPMDTISASETLENTPHVELLTSTPISKAPPNCSTISESNEHLKDEPKLLNVGLPENEILSDFQKYHCLQNNCRQNIPLRGHRDDGLIDSSSSSSIVNEGNFRELLRFRISAGDTALQKHLENTSANATYISKTTQNEIIEVCKEEIFDILKTKINSSTYYSVIFDETTDASHTSQKSLIITYLDESILREDFLEFINCHKENYDKENNNKEPVMSGEVLAKTVINTLSKHGELTESGVPDLDNIDKVSLKRRLRYQQNLRDVLRKRFRDEYLGQLIMRPTKNKANQRIVVGDIGLIENEGHSIMTSVCLKKQHHYLIRSKSECIYSIQYFWTKMKFL